MTCIVRAQVGVVLWLVIAYDMTYSSYGRFDSLD